MNEPTVKKIPVENRLRKLFPDQTGRTRETIVEAADTIDILKADVALLRESLGWLIQQMPEPFLPGIYTDGYRKAKEALEVTK